MTSPLRVVLVEDSRVQAAALARMLEAEGDIVVVATAPDAAAGVDAVAEHRPDVVTMDLDLPGSGQRAIERVMAETPTPILVVSGVVSSAREAPAVRALAAGAVEALPKPRVWKDEDAAELRRQVRRVGRIPVIRRRPKPVPRVRLRRGGHAGTATGAILAIAASTGGPPAVASLIAGLAGTHARILLVQHIHPSFAGGLAAWLATVTGMEAEIARDGARTQPGRLYVAPGEAHLLLGPQGRLALAERPATLHRPSADVLFGSVAAQAGPAAVGVVLTGMGEDGAAGLLAMREAGARTFAQDEASSVVYGMPRAAERLGAAERMVGLDDLPLAVREALRDIP